ncbi:unnamed protein product, partial [Meganyctiphanes norvegica]
GNMMTYMVSYMHKNVSETITYSNIIWVNSITTLSQGLFMVLGGFLEARVGPRITCFIGCSILSSGIMLTSVTIKESLPMVLLTYGLLAGLGISLSYVSPLACGMKWFPDKKGLINGLIVAGFGLGALGSTNFQTLYLNPENKSPGPDGYFDDPAILERVPSVFISLGVIFLVMQYTGCLFLSKPAQNSETHHQQDRQRLLDEEVESVDENVHIDVSKKEPYLNKDLRPIEMIKNGTFYCLWFIYLFNTIGIGYINAMYKSFGQTFIKNDLLLAQVGSFAAVFNCAGRIFWGKLMDKTSFRFSMRILSVCLSLLFATLSFTVHLGQIAFTAWIWAIFFTFSGTFVLMPTAAEKAFGSTHYTANYGLFFTSQVVSGPLIAAGNQALLHAVGYSGCFLVVALVISLSTVLTFIVPKNL